MTEKPSLGTRVWSAVKREPLVLFFVLGGAAFWIWTRNAPVKVEPLRIDTTVVHGLATQRAVDLGRPLTSREREAVSNRFIDDEVLLREAIRRELHLSDTTVRNRLLKIMRDSLSESVPDPSIVRLQGYFAENVERFTSPESVTLDNVFVPWGDEISDRELDRVLSVLRSGADPPVFDAGGSMTRQLIPRAARADLVETYGAGFADVVETLSVEGWYGPVESVRGIHLVRVVERHPPRIPSFDEVKWRLRQDYLSTQRRGVQQRRISEIRREYEIVVSEE